jgi:hypothetical protein
MKGVELLIVRGSRLQGVAGLYVVPFVKALPFAHDTISWFGDVQFGLLGDYS